MLPLFFTAPYLYRINRIVNMRGKRAVTCKKQLYPTDKIYNKN